VAILQLAIHLYHEDQRLHYQDWTLVAKDVLEELGLSEDTLPELMDIVIERYHRAE
jgi:hypothetical protein